MNGLVRSIGHQLFSMRTDVLVPQHLPTCPRFLIHADRNEGTEHSSEKEGPKVTLVSPVSS